MRQILTCVGSILAITLASAQSDSASFATYYEKETVYFRGNGLVYNGYKIKPGPMVFDYSPAGMAEYRNSIRAKRHFLVSYVATLGLLVGSVASGNERTAGLMLAGSVVTFSFSMHFIGKSTNHLHKSVWLRNRDALNRRR